MSDRLEEFRQKRENEDEDQWRARLHADPEWKAQHNLRLRAWDEEYRQFTEWRNRVRTEPDHVVAVELALSYPHLGSDGHHPMADLMLAHAALAVVEALRSNTNRPDG